MRGLAIRPSNLPKTGWPKTLRLQATSILHCMPRLRASVQYSDFGADKAMALLTYAVFGGIDVWFGGVLGAAILSSLPVLLQVFDHWRLEIYGAIILVVMSLRPQGVLALDLYEGLLGIWQRFKLSWKHP